MMMGTKFNNPQEKFEYRIKKQNSVELCIINSLRDRECFSWENGMSFEELKGEVELRRKRPFCKGTIYESISLINRYGRRFAVYIRSAHGPVITDENETKIVYRYFIPIEQFDVSNEKRDLDHKEQIINLKKGHLEYHEQVTIPQEKRLNEIQR
jgi:hypothetical protein